MVFTVNDDKTLYTKLLDIRDNNAIIKEVKFTTSLINPENDVCGRAPIQHTRGGYGVKYCHRRRR